MTGMNEDIQQIRELLDQLEKDLGEENDAAFVRNFDALEVPQLVAEVVDYVQPRLTPYEAAIYWYLFRHSVLDSGQQYVRASTRGLTKGVVLSSSGQSDNLSYGAVQDVLRRLEEKGAVGKFGDTNREGTLYKVYLPEEIAVCKEAMAQARTDPVKPVEASRELDFYNVKENRLKVFERDGYKCYRCGKQLTRFTATLDHIQPVSQGGENSFDNLVTACLHCNSSRGGHPVSDVFPHETR